jgi:hypothetical protein
MLKIKNDKGEEVEVFTQAELDAQKTAALDEYKTANPDRSSELNDLKSELESKEAELLALGSKDHNFSLVRKQKEELEAKIKQGEDRALAEINKVRSDMSNTALEVAVRGLAGEDAELAKKVRFHFSETLKSVTANNSDEFTKKIQQAYLLAAGVQAAPNALGGAIYGSGGAGPGAGAGSGQQRRGGAIKAEVLEMGKRHFGITDEDVKKYDNQNFSHTK